VAARPWLRFSKLPLAWHPPLDQASLVASSSLPLLLRWVENDLAMVVRCPWQACSVRDGRDATFEPPSLASLCFGRGDSAWTCAYKRAEGQGPWPSPVQRHRGMAGVRTAASKPGRVKGGVRSLPLGSGRLGGGAGVRRSSGVR
jgi:hypothetical protein